jgi:tetratricopeptide (TPR) repeat protein
MLFAAGHAADALRMATAIVREGPSDELWYRDGLFAQGIALTFGPTPVEEAIGIIESHIDPSGQTELASAPLSGIARLRVLQGRFDEALELLQRAHRGFEELGNRQLLAGNRGPRAEIDLLLGNVGAAEEHARRAYDEMTATGDRSFASTLAVTLARVLLAKGDPDEAERFALIAVETSAPDDVISQAGGRGVRAVVLSQRDQHDQAIDLAREAEAILARTDYLVQHGEVTEDLAIVLDRAGRSQEAMEAAHRALDLYRAKGASAYAERIERIIASSGRESG